MWFILLILFGWLFYLYCNKNFRSIQKRLNDLEKRFIDVGVENAPSKKMDVLISETVPPSTEALPQAAQREEDKRAPEKRLKPSVVSVWFDQLRTQMTGEEWETVVGGRWLNKIGALIFVIGVALFLGYSLRYFGPLGKIMIGLITSSGLLIVGAALEPKLQYVVFARGLLGAGWACLYFTTYATHALPASRVVHQPVAAFFVLFAVAVGMIIHSLKYRSESVTGLAYFIGFTTLVLTPVTGFSAIALLILVFSLLFLSQRFSWNKMAVFGLLATYLIYALKVSGTIITADISLWIFLKYHLMVILYWFFFEGYDLINLKRQTRNRQIAQAIFPLNACCFIGVSLLQWSTSTSFNLSLFFGVTAFLYIISGVCRAILKTPKSNLDISEILSQTIEGGYEGAAATAVVFLIPFVFLRFTGLNVNIALLLLAEITFLLGIYFRQTFLRLLALAVFALPFGRLLLTSLDAKEIFTIGLMKLHTVTPVALLAAAICYINRACAQITQGIKNLKYEMAYTYAAVLLLIVATRLEFPKEFVSLTWLITGAFLFEVGLFLSLSELRFQAYGTAVLSALGLLGINIFIIGGKDISSIVTFISFALAGYGIFAQLRKEPPQIVSTNEQKIIRHVSSLVGTTALAFLCWYVLPVPIIALGWALIGLLLIELGMLIDEPQLRLEGNVMICISFLRLFMANFTGAGATWIISHRLLTVLPTIFLFYYLSSRIMLEKAQPWEKVLGRCYFYFPAVLAFFLIRFELGRVITVIGWATLALLFALLGVRSGNFDLRIQAYVIGAITFLRAWTANYQLPVLPGLFNRFFISISVILCFYLMQFILPKQGKQRVDLAVNIFDYFFLIVDRYSRIIFSALASILLAVLLYYEVSGGLLTVFWALQASAMLAVGFLIRERALRLFGLFLLTVCIFKVFFYDLGGLIILYRIASFIVLGLLLLAVSFLYSLYRDRIRGYLTEE